MKLIAASLAPNLSRPIQGRYKSHLTLIVFALTIGLAILARNSRRPWIQGIINSTKWMRWQILYERASAQNTGEFFVSHRSDAKQTSTSIYRVFLQIYEVYVRVCAKHLNKIESLKKCTRKMDITTKECNS